MSRKTNEQILKKMMTFSRYGALSQVFIMQAIEKYADAVVAAGPEAVDSGFINGRSWHGVAQEIKATLDEHYGLSVPKGRSMQYGHKDGLQLNPAEAA